MTYPIETSKTYEPMMEENFEETMKKMGLNGEMKM